MLLHCVYICAQCEGLVTGSANGGVNEQNYNLGWALYHAGARTFSGTIAGGSGGVGGSSIPTKGTLAEVRVY
jgi:hypothetical protein